VTTHSLYSPTPGEPLTWRPYGCRWRHVTGPALSSCVAATGRIKFMGESTMGQVYEYFQAHMALAQHAWPRVIPIDGSRVAYAHDNMRAQGLHSEFHGLPTMLDNGQARDELVSFRPAVVLHLQAANDAARDTFALYKERLANYTALLAALQDGSDARLRGEALHARLLWITAPVRHYKAGNGPGTAECKEGTLDSCRAVDSGTSFRHIAGEVAWVTHPGAPPLFYGTLDRRRAFNAHAVAHMRAAFPDIQVVDFEAMTEALPSDYNMDGEHWGCNYEKWQGRCGAWRAARCCAHAPFRTPARWLTIHAAPDETRVAGTARRFSAARWRT
jgi:hypothetical protein